MIPIINSNSKNFHLQIQSFLQKKKADFENATKITSDIINDIRQRKDDALLKLSKQLDKSNFSSIEELKIDKKLIQQAYNNIDDDFKKAINKAQQRILTYHQKQLPKDFFYHDEEGNELGNIWRPIERIGSYIPGGTAIYPSSILMNCLPAKVAGVKEIAIATPPFAGKIRNEILAVAHICDIEEIYLIGGAQAIAALALGTKLIKKCNKIVGPGNSYVSAAKKLLYGEVGIDMIAGPTDICVIADAAAIDNSSWIATDMLSQAEHGIDSSAVLVTNSHNLAQQVINDIKKLVIDNPRRSIINKSLANFSAVIITQNIEDEAITVVNEIAPEHLEIITEKPKKILAKINNAGAIFLGKYSAEAIGDYIAGPSHTLPTNSSAKFSSGLSVYDFLTRSSVINCSKKGFQKIAPAALKLSQAEMLPAHSDSIKIRI